MLDWLEDPGDDLVGRVWGPAVYSLSPGVVASRAHETHPNER